MYRLVIHKADYAGGDAYCNRAYATEATDFTYRDMEEVEKNKSAWEEYDIVEYCKEPECQFRKPKAIKITQKIKI